MKLWYHPEEVVGHKALVLSGETLYVGSPREEDLPRLATALREGPSPVKFLGKNGEEIAINDLNKIAAKERADHMTIHHGNNTSIVGFQDASQRDEALAELETALALRRETNTVSRARAVVAPGILLTIALAVTYACSQAAAEIETGQEIVITGRHQAIKRLALSGLDLLGPTGVAIAGGLVALVAVLWMVRRAAKPPMMVTLRR